VTLWRLCATFALAACVLASATQGRADDSPAPVRSVRYTQAHADRVLLAPSAETQPEHTLFLSSYEVALLQAGYAFSDRLHASLSGLVTGQFFEINVKANVLRSRVLRVAVLSAIDYARADEDDDNDDDDDDDEDGDAATHLIFGRAGGALQLCFELRCRSSLTLSGTLVIHDQADILLPIGVAAGVTAFVSDEISLLLEYSSVLNAARDLELIDLPLYLIAYGVRISGDEDWALDVALLRPLDSEDEIATSAPDVFDVLGLPLLVFTYRVPT
jgi:hypothetical protein